MRLIDADELKKTIQWSEIVRLSITEISKIIDDAPTVERPQGEWIEVEPTEEDKEYGFDTRIVCSRCYEPDSHFDYDEYHKPKAVWYFRPNFCPNCGAEMERESHEVL